MMVSPAWLAGGALLLSGLMALGLWVAPALAQSSVGARDREVEKLVTTAIALRARGQDLAALETLKRAAQTDPGSVRVQVHLSNVHQALGRWLAADQWLRLALIRAHDPYVLRHREALDAARRVIDDNLGMLEVAGQPAGAEVRLNGRLLGTLPLTAPVTVGSYTLEVERPGHYSARRPIVVAARSLVRESVRLERLPTDELITRTFPLGSGLQEPAARDDVPDRPAERAWLTWSLAGVAVAAGATSIGAVVYREAHAKHWNDDSRCLAPGQTRGERCSRERDKVESAEGLALATGVAAGVFTAGALLEAFVFGAPSARRMALAGCHLSPAGASCFGSF